MVTNITIREKSATLNLAVFKDHPRDTKVGNMSLFISTLLKHNVFMLRCHYGSSSAASQFIHFVCCCCVAAVSAFAICLTVHPLDFE